MRKSAKFAVSIPWEEFVELEAIRKKAGLSRSGFLLATFRAWKEARELERLVKDYENGYRRKPEDASAAEAMAATAAESMPEEDWTRKRARSGGPGSNLRQDGGLSSFSAGTKPIR